MTEQQIEAMARAMASMAFDEEKIYGNLVEDILRADYIGTHWPLHIARASFLIAALEATPEYRALVEDANAFRQQCIGMVPIDAARRAE